MRDRLFSTVVTAPGAAYASMMYKKYTSRRASQDAGAVLLLSSDVNGRLAW